MSVLNKAPLLGGKYSKDFFDKMAAQPLWDSWSEVLYPRTLEDAFRWGRWLRTRFGDVVAALTRSASYLIDGIELDTDMEDLESRDRYNRLLTKHHKMIQQLIDVAIDLEFYGNSFTTVTQPITRTLVCPECGQTRYLTSMTRGRDYDYEGGKFVYTCSCKRRVTAIVKDYIDTKADRPLNVIRWNPFSLDIDHCPLTNAEKITYTPTKEDREFIDNEAQSVALETLPKILLSALTSDAAIEFSKGECFHASVPVDCMSVDEMRGWGLPPFLPSFRYVVMLMLLDRQTEACVKDFILPIRLLFPDPASAKSGSDPMGGVNTLHMGALRQSVENALRAQSYQQSSWQMVPAPVASMQLGGDGKALIPVDLLGFAKNRLLDSLGVPAEMYQATLTNGSGSVNAMRIYERSRAARLSVLDDYFNWYLTKTTRSLGWPAMSGEIRRPSNADDTKFEPLMMLSERGIVSMTTIARMFGVNPDAERVRIREEVIRNAKEQKKTEDIINKSDIMFATQGMGMQMTLENAAAAEQMAAQGQPPPGVDPAAAGGAPPAGMPMPPPGGGPMPGADPITQIQNLRSVMAPTAVSIDQLNADADTVANLLFHTPVGIPRNQIYSMVKQANPTLHNIAKGKLEQLEGQAKQQGLMAARQG